MLVGNREWLQRNGVEVKDEVERQLCREEMGRTAVLLAVQGRVLVIPAPAGRRVPLPRGARPCRIPSPEIESVACRNHLVSDGRNSFYFTERSHVLSTVPAHL